MLRAARAWAGTALSILLAISPAVSGDQPDAGQSEKAPPAAADMGRLSLKLSGNLSFCVNGNEISFKPGAVKPRQYRSAPLITTFGYKYQISVTRRGSSGIVKLLESPTYPTAYTTLERKETGPPQPRLATPKDLKKPSQPFRPPQKVPHWISENTCTKLKPDYSFPLAAGHYDIYLGFDLLLNTGQWVPLQSDYLTDIVIDKDSVTQVDGLVDYTDGVRTVHLDTAHNPVAIPTP